MKKTYMIPTMKVIMIQHRTHLLAGSGEARNGVQSISNDEGFTLFTDGFGDGEADY
ncbi:MAG: hypothetical protein IJ868_09900 [Prevotella sp.]|nr:hypothetical protein [Prevotella sp.]